MRLWLQREEEGGGGGGGDGRRANGTYLFRSVREGLEERGEGTIIRSKDLGFVYARTEKRQKTTTTTN